MEPALVGIRGGRLTRRGALAIVSGGVVLAACGSSSDTAPPPEVKGTAIDVWAWNPDAHPETIALKKVMDAFAAGPSGVKVNFTAPAEGGVKAFEKLVSAVAGGSPPDAAIGQHFYLSDLFRKDAILDVDAGLKANADWKKARSGLTPELLGGGFSWKGKVFAVPAYTSHFAMYFQTEFLKKAALPAPPPKGWTWDQFVDYQKKAAQPPSVTGYDDQWSYTRTSMLALNNGHRFMNSDGTKFSYNSPEAVEAVEFQLSLIKQGLMRAHDGDKGGYTEKLAQGQVVFQFGVAARVKTYRKDNVQFGTCVYPIGKSSKDKKNVTHGEGYGLAVFKTKDAKRQQAAWLAATWVARPDAGLTFAREAGVPPAYTYVLEDKAFVDEFKKDSESWPFYELISGFIPMPNFPSFGDVRSMGDKMIPDIWAGKANAKQVLDEYTRLAQQKLDEVLK